jgi:hypothetical protein
MPSDGDYKAADTMHRDSMAKTSHWHTADGLVIQEGTTNMYDYDYIKAVHDSRLCRLAPRLATPRLTSDA